MCDVHFRPLCYFFVSDFVFASFYGHCAVSAPHSLSKGILTKAIFLVESRDTIFQAEYLWPSVSFQSVTLLRMVNS